MAKTMMVGGLSFKFDEPTEGGFHIGTPNKVISVKPELLHPMNQDDASTYVSRENYRMASVKDFLTAGRHAFFQRNSCDEAKTIEKFRSFLEESIRGRGLLTSTRLEHASKSSGQLNAIIHAYKMSHQERRNVTYELTGPDGKLMNVLSPEFCRDLTDVTLEQVNETLDWINRTSCNYLSRVERKPETGILETVARFFANSNWAGLGCVGGPSVRYGSLGVK